MSVYELSKLKKIFIRIKNKIIFIFILYFPLNFKYFFLPFPSHNFGFNRKLSKKKYLDLFKKIKKKKYPNINKIEKKFLRKINTNYLDKLALTTQITHKKNQINYQHGRLLYGYLYNLIKLKKLRFINIFETGTARGFSSICMSRAIIDTKIKGKIDTIDILPHNQKMMWNSIHDHDGPLTRRQLLNPWSKEMKNINFIQDWSISYIDKKKNNLKRYNFAFLDAAHDFKSAYKEFLFVSKNQKKNDIIFFDDINKTSFKDLFKIKKFLTENFKKYDFNFLKNTKNRSYLIANRNND